MDKIDRHSDTWRAIELRLQVIRSDCLSSLINGTRNDDKLRGKIELVDDLIAYSKEEPETEISPEPDKLPNTDY
jgi:hypothetical protein